MNVSWRKGTQSNNEPARTSALPIRSGRLRYFCILAPLVVVAAACGAGESTGARTVARDSAGIRIVENGARAWAEGEAWSVSPMPTVDIGVLQGAPEYQLFGAYSAVRLGDGRIVVANGGTEELRFYDSAGRHLLTVGRKGGGPGEFNGLRWVGALAGDTVLAWDWDSKRVSLFAPEGHFIRSVRAEGIGGLAPDLIGVFADGSFIVTQGFRPDFSAGTQIARADVAYLRFGPDGALRDTLGPFPGPQQITVTGGSDDNRWLSVRRLPFARETHVVVQGDHAYVANSDRYEIAIYTRAGALTALIRKHHELLDVTAEHVDQFKQDYLAPPEGEEPDENRRRRDERILAEMPFPETFPALNDLRVDAVGNIWVEEYRPPNDERPSVWTVFDDTGRLLGTVQTPAELIILQIGADFVLGRWEDEFDVDHIRLYELIKPGASTTAMRVPGGRPGGGAPPAQQLRDIEPEESPTDREEILDVVGQAPMSSTPAVQGEAQVAAEPPADRVSPAAMLPRSAVVTSERSAS